MVKIEFEFEFGHCNGSMNLDIYLGSTRLLELSNVVETIRVEHIFVPWPSTITINLSNKDMARDTEQDINGKIVADKYVKLLRMLVNGVELNPQALYSVCGEIYWGQPGTVAIEFSEANPMRWNLALNNVLYFREV